MNQVKNMQKLPGTMQAVVLIGHGSLDMLQYRDHPVPIPAADEVLLEVHACGMNNTDVWVRQGAYGTDDDPDAVASWRRGKPTREFPRIQGADSLDDMGLRCDRIGAHHLGPA